MNTAEIKQALEKTKGWEIDNGRLCKHFQFKNFVEAFSFMSLCAIVAEKQNHHPEWKNIYSNVWVELTTHDEGNIVTDKDIRLAEAFDAISHKFEA